MTKNIDTQESEMEKVKNIVELGKKFGVELNNIEFRIGKHGIEVHKKIQNRYFRIFIPDRLIIDKKRVDFTGNIPFLKDSVDKTESDFFNEYFSLIWSTSRKEIIGSKITHLKTHKDIYGGIGFEDLLAINPENSNYNEIISGMYSISYLDSVGEKRPSFMPILDFVNHHEDGLRYIPTKAGLEVHGENGHSEVYARYNLHDAIGQYAVYLFSEKTNYGYSLPMQIPLRDGRKLIIRRNLGNRIHANGAFYPSISKNEKEIVFSFVMISNKMYPSRPVKEFLQLASELKIEYSFHIWDRIKANNLQRLLRVYKKIVDLPISDESSIMKKCISDQLHSISY